MTWFLAVVLLTAAAMSFLKLALLPRRYAIALALLLAPAALLFQNTLARSSLAEITRQVTGFEALRDWCALLVVQELIACLAAARALRAEADGSKPPLWSYLPGCRRCSCRSAWSYSRSTVSTTFCNGNSVRSPRCWPSLCLSPELPLRNAPADSAAVAMNASNGSFRANCSLSCSACFSRSPHRRSCSPASPPPPTDFRP